MLTETFPSPATPIDPKKMHDKLVQLIVNRLKEKKEKPDQITVEYKIPGSKCKIDILVEQKGCFFGVEVKSGYVPIWNVYLQNKRHREAAARVPALQGIKFRFIVAYDMCPEEEQELKDRCGDVSVMRCLDEMKCLGLKQIPYRVVRWELPYMSWVVDSCQDRLVLSRPDLVYCFTEKATDQLFGKFSSIKQGRVVACSGKGKRRETSDGSIITRGYWADNNDERCDWKSFCDPKYRPRPVLYVEGTPSDFVVQSNDEMVGPPDVKLRFVPDEFGALPLARNSFTDINW